MLHTFRALGGIVSSPHHAASQAGLEVLRDGGSAAEAAIATAATLAVVYPHMNGLGGDNFFLVAEPGESPVAVEACGRAALAADPATYRARGLVAIPRRGPLAAITVAGAVSGWDAVLRLDRARSPRAALPLDRLLRDPIRHAADGIAPARSLLGTIAARGAELRDVPGFAALFLPDGRPPDPWTPFRQPALARTLSVLAAEGLHDLYRGSLARLVAADLAAAGSPLCAADLSAHGAATGAPLHVRVSGATVFNTRPPTQGAASLMILALFARLGVTEPDGFAHVHGLVEATKYAFRFRDAHLQDPDFATVDAQHVLDDEPGLDAAAAAIDPGRAAAWPTPPASGGDTVWFGAVDRRGQVVSAIQSTYFEFGSGVVLPATGIVWQNRGASFALGGAANALRPRARPFHTLNPALARFDDGRVLAYGAMGGDGQPQFQAAIFTRHALFGQELQRAVSAPRWLLGRTWGDAAPTLKLERRFDPAVADALRRAGHPVELIADLSDLTGHAGAVLRHPSGILEGAADPRSDGAVAAL